MFQFLAEKKKYWIIPIIVVLLLIGLLIALSAESPIAAFIYTIF